MRENPRFSPQGPPATAAPGVARPGRRVSFLLAATLLGLGATGPARGEASTRHSLVDRSIALHGGELYEGSRTRLELCSAAGCSRLEVTVDGGLYEYVVTGPYRDSTRRVRLTNETVEHWMDGEPREIGEAAEAQRLRDWVMARVYFCFLPYRLNDPGVLKEDQGLESWGDRRLRRVKVTFRPGVGTDSQDEYVYWLDPESGRVEMFAYSYERGAPGLRFRRAFNYRRVGGLLFFDQENWGTEGEGLTVDLIDPDYVASALRRVSTVELRGIEVESLD